MDDNDVTVCASDEEQTLVITLRVLPCIDKKTFDPIGAIKAATKEFAWTPLGMKFVESNHGVMNYGDFIDAVPDAICKKHGFTVHGAVSTEIQVSHDANLLD